MAISYKLQYVESLDIEGIITGQKTESNAYPCYLDKVKRLNPGMVVGDLLQSSGMVNNAVVGNASGKVHKHCNAKTKQVCRKI